ncbi:hypothetical protein [Halovivax gelatinilyticus]|uniref:DUF5789 family protein n=1 Tax=Halovivax gelatinilyticus TaxID=2961597 RepID=UPI0020CA3CF2|nr:hypothetical protein [Halovivax gelatinilyticus]
MTDESADRERAQRRINERKADRAETTESIVADVEARLGEVQYPVTGEELSREYALDEIDLPNETESLASAFDRLATDEFASEAEAREAILGEITGEAGDRHEANAERDLQELDESSQSAVSDTGADGAD